MTVEELRRILADIPGDWPVILQKDAEGNGYSPLEGGEEGMYDAYNTWSGEVSPTPEQIADPTSGYDEDDQAPDEAVRAYVLYPAN